MSLLSSLTAREGFWWPSWRPSLWHNPWDELRMRAAGYAISAQPYLIRRTTPMTGSIFTPGMPYTHAQAKVGKHNFQLDDLAAALVLTVQKRLSGRSHPIASSAGPITASRARSLWTLLSPRPSHVENGPHREPQGMGCDRPSSAF